MEVSGQLHAPDAIAPGKDPRYPLDRRLRGPQSRSRRCGKEKIFPTAGNPIPVVKLVARPYNNWATIVEGKMILKPTLKEAECESVSWIQLVQDSSSNRIHWIR
jgi:hypothetical protein